MQKTIKETFSVQGAGVHTGNHAKVTIKPAPPDHGIVFCRDGISIPALVENVSETGHGVTLKSNGKEIKTCEHILSALYGLGIDNAICEVEGDEIPVLDGSSLQFTKHIKVRGYSDTSLQKKELEITEPIFLEAKSACIFAVPSKEFKITFLIDYPHPGITTQYAIFTISRSVYNREIAPARTYAFEDWLNKLREGGLIQGGSFENAVVISADGPLNSLRFQDEQVRHKILDLIGDLALLGKRFKGWVFGIKSGHTLNIEFVRRISGI